MAESFTILKRTVTYTSEDAGRGTGGIGYDVIPYPEAASEPDASKTTPTITLSPTTITTGALKTALTNADYYDVTISYNGDGTLYVELLVDRSDLYVFAAKIVDGNKLRIFKDECMEIDAFNYTVRSTTTDTCNPAAATFSIT